MVYKNILDYGGEKCFRLWYRKMFQVLWFRKIFGIYGKNNLDDGVEKCFGYMDMVQKNVLDFYGLEQYLYFAFMAKIFQIMVQKNAFRFYGLELWLKILWFLEKYFASKC